MAEVFWKPQYHWHILSFFVQGWTWHEWGGQVHDYNQLLRVSLLLRFTINFYLPWICTRDQPIPVTRLATSTFDYAHPKKFWSAFTFCESVSTCKKIRLFNLSILQMQPILKPHHMTGHAHFWPRKPSKPACKK